MKPLRSLPGVALTLPVGCGDPIGIEVEPILSGITDGNSVTCAASAPVIGLIPAA